MKALLTSTALATALMVTITGAQAESMDFETSDTDTIVVGATAEKVTLRVTGFKNMKPSTSAPAKTKLGTFYMTTSSGLGALAVTYGPENTPLPGNNGVAVVSGMLTNESGEQVNTYLYGSDASIGTPFTVVAVNGTQWSVVKTPVTTFEGGIYTYGSAAAPLPAGVYPITLRAALYQP